MCVTVGNKKGRRAAPMTALWCGHVDTGLPGALGGVSRPGAEAGAVRTVPRGFLVT